LVEQVTSQGVGNPSSVTVVLLRRASSAGIRANRTLRNVLKTGPRDKNLASLVMTVIGSLIVFYFFIAVSFDQFPPYQTEERKVPGRAIQRLLESYLNIRRVET
jgi:hypothetical protein